MNVDAFLTKLTLREVRAFLLGMEVLAFIIGVVAVRPMPTSDLLFVILCTCLLGFLYSLPNVVLVLTEINHCVVGIELDFFLLLQCNFLHWWGSLDSLVDVLSWYG